MSQFQRELNRPLPNTPAWQVRSILLDIPEFNRYTYLTMNLPLVLKSIAIGVLTLVLVIFLQLVYSQVRDRQARQQEVERNIAESAAGPQVLLMPTIVLQYTERVPVTTIEQGRSIESLQDRERTVLIGARAMEADIQVAVDRKKRGIFSAQLFTAQHRLKGIFDIPADWGVALEARDVIAAKAFLVVGLSDARGVIGMPRVTFGGESGLRVQPGTQLPFVAEGFHVPLDLKRGTARAEALSVDLDVLGVSRLAFVPTAKESTIRLNSAWPHPSFFGRALPQSKGSDTTETPPLPATWKVSHLSHHALPKLQALADQGIRNPKGEASAGLGTFEANAFGVSFIDPVNIYLLAERAVKYGLLFIVLTFVAFFLFEILKQLPIHAIQYGMVGAALAMFFLLLLALSEHVGFSLAYLLAATACTALIGVYLIKVLASWRLGAAFAAGLALIYAALFGLLQSEDMALLLGSGLLFAILAGVMLLTRGVDWQTLLARRNEKAAPPHS
jgi:inner membrane protein